MNYKEVRLANIQNYIASLLRLTILVAIILELINRQWLLSFVSFSILILTYIPSFFEKQYKINIPPELELLAILFIYAALFLGEIQSFYTRFWWWDVLMHIGSGIGFGFIGFLILYALYYRGKLKASPFWICLFSFSFALGLGALWEIFEFAMDSFFGLNMQESGLLDTMWDLIVDALGALIISAIGYYYIKKERTSVIVNILDKLRKQTPKLKNNSTNKN